MRASVCVLAALLLLGGCGRARRPAPDAVAVKAAGADLLRYRALATGCGAASPRTETDKGATFLVVGKDSPAAVRDCFYEAVRADYRAQHPVRAWIEDRLP